MKMTSLLFAICPPESICRIGEVAGGGGAAEAGLHAVVMPARVMARVRSQCDVSWRSP